MRLHTNKQGIRALGVAESFRRGMSNSVLGGVVMRGDLVIDGLASGRTRVGGDDATASVASLYRRLARNDVNILMISGCILSLYNIVDPDELSRWTRLPVICLTYRETSGIEYSIRRRFPEDAGKKLLAYRRLGERRRLRLSTGKSLYVRTAGVPFGQAEKVVDMFTLQGSVPEPVRVAKLLARTLSRRS